uniref:Uncharacterized protein n=1 Tax=Ditylenchus dipsaci TaxID=166011 RepID=A0A915DQB6_9BILA
MIVLAAFMIICVLVSVNAEKNTIKVIFSDNLHVTHIDLRVLQVDQSEKILELKKYQSRQTVQRNNKSVFFETIRDADFFNRCIFQLRVKINEDRRAWSQPFDFSKDSTITHINYNKERFFSVEQRQAVNKANPALPKTDEELQYYQLLRKEYFNIHVYVHDEDITDIKLHLVTGQHQQAFGGIQETEKVEGLNYAKSFNFLFNEEFSFYDLINGTFGLTAHKSERHTIIHPNNNLISE